MFELKRSEIKKAEKLANKVTGKKECRVTGYSLGKEDDLGYAAVRCEICSNDMSEREPDIYISACMWDRRKSFACK